MGVRLGLIGNRGDGERVLFFSSLGSLSSFLVSLCSSLVSCRQALSSGFARRWKVAGLSHACFFPLTRACCSAVLV